MAKFVKIDFPPGVARRGTLYENAGRWYDSSLVRWYEGGMYPVGGWSQRTTVAVDGMPRALLAWIDNLKFWRLAVGTNTKLYALSQSQTDLTGADITPVDLVTGRADAIDGGGYGIGYYGTGIYGAPRADGVSVFEADTWSLDTYDQDLLACLTSDGRILTWPRTGLAAALTNAPTSCSGVIVTPDRFVMALAAGGFQRLVQWSDQEAPTVWTPTSTNQAGDQTLQTQGRIMCAANTRSGTVIWTDQDAHLAQYIRLPYVFSIDPIGRQCGIISRKAFAVADSVVYWMSAAGFFVWDGGAVQKLPCDVYDLVFNDMSRAQRSKTWAWYNSAYGEVWWHYCSADSTEIDRYVVFNIREGHWTIGALVRTSGIDRGLPAYPILASSDGHTYNHENGVGWGGSTPYAESGPQEIGEGDAITRVRRLIFDEKTSGDVQVSMKMRDWPNGTETTAGPYASGNPVSVRLAGRQMRLRVEFLQAGEWGTPRFEVIEGGKR